MNRAYRIKKRARLTAIKSIAGCTDCGTHDPDVLEWDHLPDYVKTFNISQAIGHSKRDLAREMMKCEVVCANCHVKRTVRRRLSGEPSGPLLRLPLVSHHLTRCN